MSIQIAEASRVRGQVTHELAFTVGVLGVVSRMHQGKRFACRIDGEVSLSDSTKTEDGRCKACSVRCGRPMEEPGGGALSDMLTGGTVRDVTASGGRSGR